MERGKPMGAKKSFSIKTVLIAAVLLIIIFFSSIVSFLVNIQWYKEVNYLGVYMTRVFMKFELGVPIFIVMFLIIYLYMLFLKREYAGCTNTIYSQSQSKRLHKMILLISLLLSLMISAAISAAHWNDILQFIYGTSFHSADPLFHKDISFYIFRLPMYETIYNLVFTLLIIFTFATVLLYVITAARSHHSNSGSGFGGSIFGMGRRINIIPFREIIEYGGRRIAYFGSAIFIMISIGFIFNNYDLVYSSRGVAFGASYTDIHVNLLFNEIMVVISIIAAISIFYALYKKKLKLFAWVIGAMVLTFIAQGITEFAVEKFIVSPNAIEKEKTYIGYNIQYTRAAYGLDKVEEKDFPAEQNLTQADLQNNKTTIDNIRVNDFEPALEVYNQLQGIKQYYKFNDVDIDRYKINGKYTQVFVAARELDQSKLDGSSKTWQNEHLYYTHGYGVAMSPVNTVTDEGQPDLIIKDIPPVSSVDVKVDKPQIYFGEMTDDYIITNTNIKELDYPSSGSDNKETVYDGKAGIALNGLNRLLFMLDKGSMNFILSQDIKSDSKLIMNRNIKDRVEKIAPFLVYDNDPYIVINGGKLYWIIDAYTVSSSYPYSEQYNGINYIRNSVKVIIDAYDGTTNFYLMDTSDPIAETYSKIYPELFKSKSEIPAGFTEHFRYPEDIFNVQSQVYEKYHMTNPKVFYNKEDMWSLVGAGQSDTNKDSQVEPAYLVMKLPDGTDEEFILMSSYTPPQKDNMTAWLAARMDGDNYGKLIVYKFPKDKLTYGPSQFRAMVNQDTTISKELSLWNQEGSSASMGNVITIPIEKSLLYVLPVYIKSTGTNSIPEMKRVVLGYGDKIVMEDTLENALSTMFQLKQPDNSQTQQNQGTGNSTGGTGTGKVTSNVQDLIKKANDAFLKAKEAQQNGDWAQYGTYLKELEGYLNQLNSEAK